MSNPFAPPGHQPAQPFQVPPSQVPPQAQQFGQPQPQDPQSWAPVHHPGYAVPLQQPSGLPPQQLPPAPRGGNGLAITAVVMSGLALLGVLAMGVFFFVAASSGSPVLSGEVTVIDKGASDGDLQESLIAAIEDDGGSVDELRCPLRSQVGQGLVTVCHGSVDGFDWTGVVVFEDDEGAFIVTEY